MPGQLRKNTLETSCTLIISTYNWTEALNLVLKSASHQRDLPDEIIIADDGSRKNTGEMINFYKSEFPIPLVHVWHEDIGFRKAIILNKAIARAKGDYIIQVDGDCIMHKSFVKDHLEFAQKNTYLYGCRVNIKETYLKYLNKKQQIRFNLFSKGIKKRTRALSLPLLSNFFKRSKTFSKKYRGCNASFFKADFIAVNGYNEDFEGWGREDSELALRLHNYGLYGRRLRYRAIVFHIFHKEASKSRLEANNEIELQTIKEKVVWCSNGIDKYLNEEK